MTIDRRIDEAKGLATIALERIKQGGRVADIVIFERHAEQQQRLLTKRSRAKLLEHTK